MQHDISHGPSFALLRLRLEPGETVTAEAGAMVTRTSNADMETRLNAGTGAGFFAKLWAILVAIVRKFIGGETMFINDFTAQGSPAEVTLAPPLAGQIVHKRLENERLLLQSGAYLAAGPGLKLRLRWGGLRAIFAKEGIVFLEISGTGDLFMTAYGGIQPVEVDGTFVVDNGHMVAFEAGLDFDITTPGGGFTGLLGSGEGLVCKFRGRGTVYIQSRNVSALVSWITRLLP